MATNVKEFKAWLATLDDANSVAVDDGGLTVVELAPDGKETGAYFEVGGVSKDRALGNERSQGNG